ncbi:hypothetical protein ACQKM2_16675 [Streptomyces sp. NPDC004126]|uniref:hypothetical protein n=1 Tax=Streptomyces sp. NPDC004126 TaxID=3390695 RepID=UPI003CFFD57C
MKRCMRVAVTLPVAVGLAMAYAPRALADGDASIVSAEVSGPLTPGARATVNVVVMNIKAPAGQESCTEIKTEGGGATTCFNLGAPGTSVTHAGVMVMDKDAKPGARTITVKLIPRNINGVGKDEKTISGTVGAAPPACNPVKLQKDAFALGHKEGLADGRADGYADAYRQSYDDAFKKKQGLTAEQCEEFAHKAFQDGYGRGYDTGFKEGQAKGAKEGQKEGKEDQRTGNASRNVTIETIAVKAQPSSGEIDCSFGVVFSATVQASGAGTVRFHWDRPSGKLPGTLTFGDDGAPRTAISLGTIPTGATTATLTQKFVVDSGPSKGKSEQFTANVTCKK